jgi:hypothetical protein
MTVTITLDTFNKDVKSSDENIRACLYFAVASRDIVITDETGNPLSDSQIEDMMIAEDMRRDNQ